MEGRDAKALTGVEPIPAADQLSRDLREKDDLSAPPAAQLGNAAALLNVSNVVDSGSRVWEGAGGKYYRRRPSRDESGQGSGRAERTTEVGGEGAAACAGDMEGYCPAGRSRVLTAQERLQMAQGGASVGMYARSTNVDFAIELTTSMGSERTGLRVKELAPSGRRGLEPGEVPLRIMRRFLGQQLRLPDGGRCQWRMSYGSGRSRRDWRQRYWHRINYDTWAH